MTTQTEDDLFHFNTRTTFHLNYGAWFGVAMIVFVGVLLWIG